MLTFKDYVITKYSEDDDLVKRNFARDLEIDKEFPEIYRKCEGLLYLRKYGATDEVIFTYSYLWRKYKKYRIKEIKKIVPVRRMLLDSKVYTLKDGERSLFE